MNTIQIYDLLESDEEVKKVLKGVVPIDRIPIISKFPAALVINTDPHGQKGEHWLAIYFNSRRSARFFDSYGQSPEHYGLEIPNLKWSNQRLQSDYSKLCGLYCCLFIQYMTKNRDFSSFLEKFTDNFLENDLILVFYYEIFNKFLVGK